MTGCERWITVGSVVRFAGCISRLLTSAKGLADNLSYFALAARRQLSTLELIGLEEKLQEIRGIGGAKARAICEAVKDFLKGEE